MVQETEEGRLPLFVALIDTCVLQNTAEHLAYLLLQDLLHRIPTKKVRTFRGDIVVVEGKWQAITRRKREG